MSNLLANGYGWLKGKINKYQRKRKKKKKLFFIIFILSKRRSERSLHSANGLAIFSPKFDFNFSPKDFGWKVSSRGKTGRKVREEEKAGKEKGAEKRRGTRSFV